MNTISLSPADAPPGAGITNPYNLISYAGSLAALANPLLYYWLAPTAVWSMRDTAGLLGVLGFLFFSIMMALFSPRDFDSWLREPKRRRGRLLLWAYMTSMLLAVWGFRDYAQPLLLCSMAAKAVCLAPRWFWLPFLLLANMLVSLLYLQVWPLALVLVLMLFYIILQCFIILTMLSLITLIGTRRNAQRINHELLATRQLLEESIRIEERLHLSRDLHDVAGHKLTALKLQLMLGIQQGTASKEVLTECSQLADELLQDIRSVVSTLREYEGVDLQAALRALDLGLSSPVLHFELDPTVRVPDTRQAHALLHCAQEGLTNALRHSSAKNIWIRLLESNGRVQLVVEDDGHGIYRQLRYGNGLTGLTERLAEIGGHLSIRSGRAGGTILNVSL